MYVLETIHNLSSSLSCMLFRPEGVSADMCSTSELQDGASLSFGGAGTKKVVKRNQQYCTEACIRLRAAIRSELPQARLNSHGCACEKTNYCKY